MSILILGLALWYLSHLFGRVLPGPRAALGERPGKMIVTAVSLAAIVLMVVGYRRAEADPVYTPIAGMGHLNNLLMLVAVFLMGVPHTRGVIRARLRHPMLTGTLIWALAHLLVNGDLASVVLFGGIGAWTLIAMLTINTQETWTPPVAGSARSDLIGLGIAVVLYALFAGVHIWLGKSPFLGTYG